MALGASLPLRLQVGPRSHEKVPAVLAGQMPCLLCLQARCRACCACRPDAVPARVEHACSTCGVCCRWLAYTYAAYKPELAVSRGSYMHDMLNDLEG